MKDRVRPTILRQVCRRGALPAGRTRDVPKKARSTSPRMRMRSSGASNTAAMRPTRLRPTCGSGQLDHGSRDRQGYVARPCRLYWPARLSHRYIVEICGSSPRHQGCNRESHRSLDAQPECGSGPVRVAGHKVGPAWTNLPAQGSTSSVSCILQELEPPFIGSHPQPSIPIRRGARPNTIRAAALTLGQQSPIRLVELSDTEIAPSRGRASSARRCSPKASSQKQRKCRQIDIRSNPD